MTTSLYVSRRVRESRNELRKFMREMKRGNPACTVMLQYDKLYVDNKCYIYNDVEGRVTEHTAVSTKHNSGPYCLKYGYSGGNGW